MAEQYPIQVSFGRGELSPRLAARSDIEHYKMGAAELVNWLIMRQGGIRRRPGTEDMGPPAGPCVLIPFVFSISQSYTLEFTDRALRIWNPVSGLVVNPDGTPYVVTTPYLIADMPMVQWAQSADVLTLTHAQYPPIDVARYDERDWRLTKTDIQDGPYEDFSKGITVLSLDQTGDLTQVNGGTAGTTVGWTGNNTPQNAFDNNDGTFWEAAYHDRPADLEWTFPAPVVVNSYSLLSADDTEPDYQNAQAGNVGGFSAPRTWTLEAWNGQSYVVLDQKVGETGWGPSERRYYKFKNQGAYPRYRIVVTERNDSSSQRQAVRIKTFQLGGFGPDAGQALLSATNAVELNEGRGFLPGDVGRQFRLFSDAAYWHWGTILQVNTQLQCVVEINSPPLPNTKPIALFRLGSFGLVPGYPASCCYFQQRRVFARTDRRPMTVWMSETANYPNYGSSSPAVASDGIQFDLAVQGEIAYLAESQELLLGTTEAARVFGSADKNQGFSATNFNQTKSQSFGFDKQLPVLVGDTVLAVGLHRQAVREFKFDITQGKYTAKDITVLSEHIFRKNVKRMVYTQEPNAIIWVLLDDGTLAAITYEADQQMIAIGRHVIGGNGFVESICAIPGVGRDELWLCVRRTVNGVDRRRIERLTVDFEADVQDRAQAVYLDGARRYQGAPATGVAGLDNLVGLKIQVLADGAEECRLADGVGIDQVQPGFVDTNLTLDSPALDLPSGKPASVITVGLPYASRVSTLRFPTGQDGSMIGRKQRLHGVSVDVQDTGGLFAVTKYGGPVELQLRHYDDLMDVAPPLFTGALDMTYVDDSWRSEGVIQLVAAGASPAMIRGIVLDVEYEAPEPPIQRGK